jgi:uncharacterized membrane protein YkgB
VLAQARKICAAPACLKEDVHMPGHDRPGTGDEQFAHHHDMTRARIPGLPSDALERAQAQELERRLGDNNAGLAGWPYYLSQIDRRIIELAAKWFEPIARLSIFVIYFWFGLLKLLGLSPATPLALALTDRTIGAQYFNTSFKTLAAFECTIGLLFLIPALTRISSALLLIHLVIVSSPLVLVTDVAWTGTLVPTLEGQYIIKDLALLALAVGIIARESALRIPFARRTTSPRSHSR